MHTVFTMKRFAAFLVYGFAVAAFATIFMGTVLGYFNGTEITKLRFWSYLVSGYVTALWIVFGTSWYWSPWRVVWRQVPVLNGLLFPDLNGVWMGATKSNWPIVKALRESAASIEAANIEALRDMELLEGEIAIEVRASLFAISVTSKVGQTQGDSFSLTAGLLKCPPGDFLLSYVYQQNTPEPAGTDESVHVGAALLKVIRGVPFRMEGEYWTRRKWREGLNTAGRIAVQKCSERHLPDGADLLEYGRQQAQKPAVA
ncbi:hypothetical protein [Parvibaculum sp.]|uniref:hypothetical protein n=1 Tax=Parvibaculum sp. TaxID=2024848 RepID=UPI003BAC99A8